MVSTQLIPSQYLRAGRNLGVCSPSAPSLRRNSFALSNAGSYLPAIPPLFGIGTSLRHERASSCVSISFPRSTPHAPSSPTLPLSDSPARKHQHQHSMLLGAAAPFNSRTARALCLSSVPGQYVYSTPPSPPGARFAGRWRAVCRWRNKPRSVFINPVHQPAAPARQH